MTSDEPSLLPKESILHSGGDMLRQIVQMTVFNLWERLGEISEKTNYIL